MMKKNIFLFGLILSLFFISAASCEKNNEKTNTGILEGTIKIGPICPGETNPPDQACKPTEETFKAWQINVWSADKKTKISQLNPNIDGYYNIELPDGVYILDLENQNPTALGKSGFPTKVTVYAERTVTLDINIDTGIR